RPRPAGAPAPPPGPPGPPPGRPRPPGLGLASAEFFSMPGFGRGTPGRGEPPGFGAPGRGPAEPALPGLGPGVGPDLGPGLGIPCDDAKGLLPGRPPPAPRGVRG